ELKREKKNKLILLFAKVHIFQEGEVVDRGKIFKYPISRKPMYIYNTREKKIKSKLEHVKPKLHNKKYQSAK
ncbi:hypothetical protein ACQ1Z1_15025, partial [Enterococcus faecalis]